MGLGGEGWAGCGASVGERSGQGRGGCCVGGTVGRGMHEGGAHLGRLDEGAEQRQVHLDQRLGLGLGLGLG